MKAKVVKNKRTGETRVEYYRVKNKDSFRYNLINNIFKDTDLQITAIIDTNQLVTDTDANSENTKDKPFDYIEGILKENGIVYRHFKTETNTTKFFGISTDIIKKKRKKSERIYVININSINFTNRLFYSLFSCYDTGYGLAANTDIDELIEALETEGFNDVLYSESFFAQSIYDSVVCSCLRSSFDIEKYVKETKA